MIILFVFGVIALGLFSYGHVSYVTVCTILLLPLITNLTVDRFLTVFMTLIGFNFVLGFVLWLVYVGLS